METKKSAQLIFFFLFMYGNTFSQEKIIKIKYFGAHDKPISSIYLVTEKKSNAHYGDVFRDFFDVVMVSEKTYSFVQKYITTNVVHDAPNISLGEILVSDNIESKTDTLSLLTRKDAIVYFNKLKLALVKKN